jgi:hypothetical protein
LQCWWIKFFLNSFLAAKKIGLLIRGQCTVLLNWNLRSYINEFAPSTNPVICSHFATIAIPTMQTKYSNSGFPLLLNYCPQILTSRSIMLQIYSWMLKICAAWMTSVLLCMHKCQWLVLNFYLYLSDLVTIFQKHRVISFISSLFRPLIYEIWKALLVFKYFW